MKKTDSVLLQDLISNILAKEKKRTDVPNVAMSKLREQEIRLYMCRKQRSVLGRNNQEVLHLDRTKRIL